MNVFVYAEVKLVEPEWWVLSLGYKERYDVYSLIEHTQIDPIVKLGLVKIILFLFQIIFNISRVRY